VVRDQVLKTIDSPELRVYAVWERILRSDSERAARKATTLLPDSRVTHYWADSEGLPRLFARVLPIKSGPAWDVYLIYPAGTEWTGPTPPGPKQYMHQLMDRLPGSFLLNGDSLTVWVRATLRPGT
jgi:hypothetical protein